MTISTSTSQAGLISGISVPDSKLANEITEFIRDTESTLLFNHSSRKIRNVEPLVMLPRRVKDFYRG